jgi:hypothetical protein
MFITQRYTKNASTWVVISKLYPTTTQSPLCRMHKNDKMIEAKNTTHLRPRVVSHIFAMVWVKLIADDPIVTVKCGTAINSIVFLYMNVCQNCTFRKICDVHLLLYILSSYCSFTSVSFRPIVHFTFYADIMSARSCNIVGHLFWFTILAQHETNDVILYIHSVHKHRGNSFQRQNYKMRLKQRSLNWINSMQVKKILFTNVFFSWPLCLLNMFPSMVFPKHLYFSGLLT